MRLFSRVSWGLFQYYPGRDYIPEVTAVANFALSRQVEHDPEKWAPVFPRDKRSTRLPGDHAQSNL